MFGLFKKKSVPPKPPSRFPPVPKWRPDIVQPIEAIIQRVAHYTNRKQDFAVFKHGTCVLLPPDLSDDQAADGAKKDPLPDFSLPCRHESSSHEGRQHHRPVQLSRDQRGLEGCREEHWAAIDRHHQDALATSEVLVTPLGSNTFDDFGKKALFGRCFMFMDAQAPEVIRIVRAAL